MASNQAANLYFQSPLSIILTPGHQRLWFRGEGSILKTCRKPVFKACSHTSTLHLSIILVRWEKTEKEGGLFDQLELTNTFQILSNSCYTLKFANQTLFLDVGNCYWKIANFREMLHSYKVQTRKNDFTLISYRIRYELFTKLDSHAWLFTVKHANQIR